jgi:hypothetical protein
VQFIDGSAFSETTCNQVSIEAGHERFAMQNDFLIDFVNHRLIRNFSSSSNIEMFWNLEILGSSCFSYCESLSSVSFESNSRLIRIEPKAFSYSSLQSIEIPRNVRFIDASYILNGLNDVLEMNVHEDVLMIQSVLIETQLE